MGMSTKERTKLFSKYGSPEEATLINTLYENKLLLKNRTLGVINLFKKLGQIGRYDPTKKAQLDTLIQEFKDKQLERTLSPKETESFLNDAADVMLGRHITKEQALAIFKIDKKIRDLKKSYNEETLTWSNQNDKQEYGATVRALEIYTQELGTAKSIKEALIERGYKFAEDWSENRVRAVGNVVLDTAKAIADNSVSLVASVDDSFFGRQGIFTLLTGHPKIWGRNFAKSFLDIGRTFKGQQTTDALLADLYSDPLFINGEYQKAKLVDLREEQFPTSLPEKIPVLGKFFKASEAAFVNGSLRVRTELYQMMRDMNTKKGVELSDENIKGMGSVINSLNAKGSLGKFENPIIRLLMWAPKMLKADIDILTAHSFSTIPKNARHFAMGNLVKIVAITAILEGLFSLLDPESTELDPRSSDFLSLKKNDTRIKYLRGIPAIITLMARMISGSYKSSTTGEIVEYSPGFGATSRLDALIQFIQGKAPPATGAIYDLLEGEDFDGNKPTFSSILLQRGVPISIQNAVELTKNPTIDRTFGVIADFFGLSSNTYRDSNSKSQLIPTNTVIKNDDFFSMVSVYAKAMGTDPETAFNRIFTGQKIMQVSEGGIIVVERQDVADSEAFKKQWVENNGGKVSDMKEVKLDHTIPNKLGGEEKPSNWKIVPTSVWSSYTKTENALIQAVKDKKIPLKEAQQEIVKFKSIEDTADRKEYGDALIEKYRNKKSSLLNILKPKEALAWGEQPTPENQKRIDSINAQIDSINVQLKKNRNSKLVSPVDTKALEAQRAVLSGKAMAIMTGTEKVEKKKEEKKVKPPTQTPFNKDIETVFGDEWVNATRVLKRVDDKGKIVGENVQLKTGTEVDVKNSNGSIDRGLFRINSVNFTPKEMARRKVKLANAGIDSWNDMLDPVLNIKMAKILYDERGWDPWYAAPADIISDKERARRIRLGIPLMSKIKTKSNIG